MTDKETPLAEIVGQMSLSKNTDVLTQSWVFISVNNTLYSFTLMKTQDWVKTSVFLTTTSVRFRLVEFPYRS